MSLTTPKTSEPTAIVGLVTQISFTRRLLETISCECHAVDPEINATMTGAGTGAILILDGNTPAEVFNYEDGQSVTLGLVKKSTNVQYTEDIVLGQALQQEALMEKTEQAISSFTSSEDLSFLDFLYKLNTNRSNDLEQSLKDLGGASELIYFADLDSKGESTSGLTSQTFGLPISLVPIQVLGLSKEKVICFVMPKPGVLGDLLSRVEPTIVVSQQEYHRKRVSVYDQSAVILKNLSAYATVELN